MDGNFWEMIASDKIHYNGNAVEILRRCSSKQVFKSILGRIAILLGIAHAVCKVNELAIIGRFTKEPETLIVDNQTTTIVRIDIDMVTPDLSEIAASSHFYLYITNITGQIVQVTNNL